MKNALIIGAGPAGLMAADMLADAGCQVTVVDAKPSVGRKLLMAGKSGLNLTKEEAFETFLAAYEEAAENLRPILAEFGPDQVKTWAQELGQTIFTGSTGRVFPKEMKASPLLRSWLRRLDRLGVTFHTRWRWQGWQEAACLFDTPTGPQMLTPDVTVLAMGGASWARLGSDGAWASALRDTVSLAPFQPANVGLVVDWSEFMAPLFGQPLKAVALMAGDHRVRGEAVISARGLEGGGVYAICRYLRDGTDLHVDLKPDLTVKKLAARLAKPRGKTSWSNHLRKVAGLDRAQLALLQEFGRPLPQEPDALARLIKALPVPHQGPRPLDEAISTAGGVPFSQMDGGLMLTALPGVFCAGEMLDWEAPTGGYLLTGCLATGRWAGRHAVEFVKNLDT